MTLTVWFMTTSNLTQWQLKWAEKLTEYDFKFIYWEGKKNSADDLLRQFDYKLSKTASTLTAAEIVWQFFCIIIYFCCNDTAVKMLSMTATTRWCCTQYNEYWRQQCDWNISSLWSLCLRSKLWQMWYQYDKYWRWQYNWNISSLWSLCLRSKLWQMWY